ncbi:MAG: toll/interleukin-1 receptor domain-containing protein, partial [Lewinella sp.]|nr:toll/interleukin-1 receptor domain-containing protein [Lewinella sp.]
MTKLKGFISYAHKDEPYFELIREGFRTHGKNSKLIESDLWHDGKISAGALWHETILDQVQGCDFAIFLVSANFLSSEYIEEHEFRNFLKRQEEEGFLFFPILVSPCNFKQWEELAARQFFKPSGEAYGCPEARENFTFSHLVSYNLRTGDPFPNPYREQYFVDVLVKVEATLQEYQVKKEQKRKFPTSPYFRIIPIQEIQPVDFLGPRSLPNHGFRDFYLERPYLDDHLARNFQQKQPTLVTGKPLAGKTRSI